MPKELARFVVCKRKLENTRLEIEILAAHYSRGNWL
ncbi:hypothetical protein SAMN05216334_1352 [Nitrosomonas ureae]|uniref:Uncharacterized protein n=1 Tax=Nitrosomonas ureae TaxID=44577 RepID=A0A1H5Y1E4_9PROT|nr:hypothetical protein SAMN05216334_1352 [Nitrosomonas ureae]